MRKQHSKEFKAKVALAALKGENKISGQNLGTQYLIRNQILYPIIPENSENSSFGALTRSEPRQGAIFFSRIGKNLFPFGLRGFCALEENGGGAGNRTRVPILSSMSLYARSLFFNVIRPSLTDKINPDQLLRFRVTRRSGTVSYPANVLFSSRRRT